MKHPLFFLALFLPLPAQADYNAAVLKTVNEMSLGGEYNTGGAAFQQLRSAIKVKNQKLEVDPSGVSQSFCSGATYLLFTKVVARSNKNLSREALDALLVKKGQADGQGVWGRWNANGPGTARVFHELGLGKNFTRFADAKPGDFMKIFWNDEIGQREHGHSVIYLGTYVKDGTEYVRFWSSNQGTGMRMKAVEKSKIRRVVFSRLESLEGLASAHTLPYTDGYLNSLTRVPSSPAKMYKNIGVSVGGN